MSSGARTRRAAGGALEVGLWWGLSVGVWLLTLSSVSGPDLYAAVGCGLPCGVAARAGRHAMGASWQPRLRWARWLLPLPAAIVTDGVRVMRCALRGLLGDRQQGELGEVRLATGEPAAVAAAHRALATLTISFTPGTFVLETNPEENMLVIHSMGSGWPQLGRVVRR